MVRKILAYVDGPLKYGNKSGMKHKRLRYHGNMAQEQAIWEGRTSNVKISHSTFSFEKCLWKSGNALYNRIVKGFLSILSISIYFALLCCGCPRAAPIPHVLDIILNLPPPYITSTCNIVHTVLLYTVVA